MQSRISKTNIKKKREPEYNKIAKPKKPLPKPSKFARVIYTKIVNSFNVSLLAKLSENDYQYVKNSLLEKGETFRKLVENYETDSCIIGKFLSGPHYYSELIHPKIAKTIILIGENHTNKELCESLQKDRNFYDFEEGRLVKYDFETAESMREAKLGDYFEPWSVEYILEDTLTSGIAFVDLFVEETLFHLLQGHEHDTDNRLSKIATLKSDIARVHFTDIRGNYSMSKISNVSYDAPVEFGAAVSTLYVKNQDRDTLIKYSPIFLKYYMQYFHKPGEDYISKTMKFLTKNRYLAKELDRSYLGVAIKEHFLENMRRDLEEHKIHKIDSETLEALRDISNGKDTILKMSHRHELYLFRLYYTSINVSIFDMYTLARIFKRFKTLTQPIEPQNVIVYSGSFHSERIAEFLTRLNFDQKNGREISENCLYTGREKIFFSK